jgi:hypothetical protein
MKHIFTLILVGILFLGFTSAFAQGVAINSDGSAAHISAQLDVQSTTKGFLPPRMTSAQRAAISSPAEGLLVYQTDGTAGYYYYTGSSWERLRRTLTEISSNTTLTTDDQIVFITGAITVTLPATPRHGQHLKLTTTDPTAIIHLNGGTVSQLGIDYTSNDPFETYSTPGYYVELIFINTKWYVMTAS